MAGIRARQGSDRPNEEVSPRRRPLGRRSLLLILLLALTVLLLVTYLPDRVRFDRNYAATTMVLEKDVEGVDAYLLVANGPTMSDREILLLDLSTDWQHLDEILELNKTVILTGVAPYSAEELAEKLDFYHAYAGYMEFDERGDYAREVLGARDYTSLVFRVHRLEGKEYVNYRNLSDAVLRYVRAVRERRVDAVLFEEPTDDNVAFSYEELVTETQKALQQADLLSSQLISPSVGVSPWAAVGGFTSFLLIAIWNLVFALGYAVIALVSPWLSLPYLAVIGQIAILLMVRRFVRGTGLTAAFKGVLLLFCFSVLLGISINSQMSSTAYQNGVQIFRGVKLSLAALPLFVFFRGFLRPPRRRFSRVDLLIIGGFALVMIIYLLRSGNFGPVTAFERSLRDSLDRLLIVRPRFKEVFAYPFLFYAFYRGFKHGGRLGSAIPAVGAIAVASTVNTFCHAVSPIWTGLLRSLYGLAFGAAVALIFLVIMVKRESSLERVLEKDTEVSAEQEEQ